MDSPANDA